jgi:hypothetical protein
LTGAKPAAIVLAGGGLCVTNSDAKAVLSLSSRVHYGDGGSRQRRVLVPGASAT